MEELVDRTSETPLATYFHLLETGRFEEAANCFSADALYVRPNAPRLDGPMSMLAMHGRDDILAFFHQRGFRTEHHAISRCIVDGRRCMIEGLVALPGGEEGFLFLSSAEFDDEGRISRYVSVPAALPAAEFEAVAVVDPA
jgi:hypothetical protein